MHICLHDFFKNQITKNLCAHSEYSHPLLNVRGIFFETSRSDIEFIEFLLRIRLNNLKRYIGLSSKTYKQRSKCFLIQTDLLELKLLDPLFLSIYSILELALLLPITKKLEKLADESLEAVDEISVVVFYTTSSWQWYKRKRMKKCLFVLKVFKLRTLLDTESITKWDVLLLLILGR